MLRRLTVLAAFLATTAFTATPAGAQGLQTGNLSGTVTSTDGMVLPGATVTVRSPALIGIRTAVTDTNGNYIIRGLPPGRYTVVIEFPGMAGFKQEVTVPLGDTARLDGELTVAAVAEEVTVTGSTPGILATTQTGENFRVEEI